MLAGRLKELDLSNPVIVALPRGGVPVGYEVALALGAPLDIALVRKLGAPIQPELGIGALGEGGAIVLDPGAVRALGVTREHLDTIIAGERAELERRRPRYLRDHAPVDVAGRDVVLVDDCIATGVTAAAAARVLRRRRTTANRRCAGQPSRRRRSARLVLRCNLCRSRHLLSSEAWAPGIPTSPRRATTR